MDALDRVIEVTARMGRMLFLQLLPDETRVFPLLALQSIGVLGETTQQLEIELGDLAGATVAILIVPTDEALGDQPIGETEFIDHVDRRRVEGRSPQGLGQRRKALKQHHRDARLSQAQRRGTTYGPRARDDHGFGNRHCLGILRQ